jgi:hypothetical protein
VENVLTPELMTYLTFCDGKQLKEQKKKFLVG